MKQLVAIVFLFTSSSIFAQGVDDHINWSYNKYSFSLNDTWKMDITPIVRLNQNITNFQNASLDLTLKRGIGNGLSIAVHGRSWYMPKAKMRQFIWLDLAHQLPDLSIPLKIKHRLRLHYAMDINDRMDGDFLRYVVHFSPDLKNSIVQPFFAIEPWFRFNEVNNIQRTRWEYGFNVKASNNLKLIVFMRQEDFYDLSEIYTNWIWMTGMQYTFEGTLFKNSDN